MGHWCNDTVGVKPKYKEKETCPNATLPTKEIPRGLPWDRKMAFMLYISMHFVPHTEQQIVLPLDRPFVSEV